MPKTGFTLIELMIVMALVGIILSLSLPVSLDSYRSSMFQEDVGLVLTQLRHARAAAMQNKNSQAHGVRIESQRIITADQIFSINLTLKDQDSLDIMFQPLSGNISTPLTFTLTNGSKSITIIVNQQGAILD